MKDPSRANAKRSKLAKTNCFDIAVSSKKVLESLLNSWCKLSFVHYSFLNTAQKAR